MRLTQTRPTAPVRAPYLRFPLFLLHIQLIILQFYLKAGKGHNATFFPFRAAIKSDNIRFNSFFLPKVGMCVHGKNASSHNLVPERLQVNGQVFYKCRLFAIPSARRYSPKVC